MTPKSWQLLIIMWLLNVSIAIIFGYTSTSMTYINSHGTSIFSLSATLFTTHFSHHSDQHLYSNMLALWLLLFLFPNKIQILLGAFLICILWVSCYAISTDIDTYLGFSALLYCLPGAYLCTSLVNKNHSISIGILMIFFIYLYMIVPMSIDKNDLWTPMTEAHILGFMAGFTSAFIDHVTIKNH